MTTAIMKNVFILMTKVSQPIFFQKKWVRGGFKKEEKKLMEFSIKLAGWVLDAPFFH